ncbi:hypothetical protein Sta7437_3370 [Stanieria cyanosphaera PCC 7437]|uniref:Uncharacterized protein n=1 Tax=Stanieria cyanosphaera (strain ATCC 29371 / PCC 7437) TaxID=111780 RepID=K9XXP7_STAC7|nr:hypothetical protein [Stanieria cyanosphaera]AFZ36876.1 hypothetical protein Sta7437_3370 [Stanieria cyanosphaera PCC 7437]
MLEIIGLNLISLYIKSFSVLSTALMQSQPIGFEQTASSTQHTPLKFTPNTIKLAKGKPYQSIYERENVGDEDQDEEDLEQMRREDYERREDGYDEDDNNYDRSNRSDRSDDNYWQYQRRREVLEEQKRTIENQIEELDNTYRR